MTSEFSANDESQIVINRLPEGQTEEMVEGLSKLSLKELTQKFNETIYASVQAVIWNIYSIKSKIKEKK